MLITLIVCLCFGTNVHSDILDISNSSASSSVPQRITKESCDKDNELAKIPCMSASEHEHLWGGIVKQNLARVINEDFVRKRMFDVECYLDE
ncbi:unnamed protein product [Caenorhabditis angaria]|uniref:Uncharacterized protein n=1 Tax=Caenorhabditis angaria TaxID=860376 RepID=A0A9P1N4Q6_9PELO|nr:unnamed protein product [Caenorhabditis angaria]